MSDKEEYPHWYPVAVRFRDLDPLAHVNNTVYFTYLEEARGSYFNSLISWVREEPDAAPSESAAEPASGNSRIQTGRSGRRYGMLVKQNTCTYMLPIIHSDRVEVGVRVTKVGRTSFVMECELRDSGDHTRIFATGNAVMVWCDYITGRPHPLPGSLRKAFEQMEGRAFPSPALDR